jgi:hypothetical protein
MSSGKIRLDRFVNRYSRLFSDNPYCSATLKYYESEFYCSFLKIVILFLTIWVVAILAKRSNKRHSLFIHNFKTPYKDAS